MRLFHFSEDRGIAAFEPRPVRTPSKRPPGKEWLNGPLVWAIAETHDFLYLFPRECPRIVLWALETTTVHDRAQWLGETALRVAYVEQGWIDRLSRASIHRYELPPDSFDELGEIGMWVSRTAVKPYRVEELSDLPRRLEERDVELRAIERLTALRDVWNSTLHASGIRLRNAIGWG
jgi:hypothetical protein